MTTICQAIEDFINDPTQLEDIYHSEEIMWVDWREYDEDIVAYFNASIGNEIRVEREDHGKGYGDDILLRYKDRTMMIPYEDEMERDITISSVNELLAPDYQIRLFMESLGNDTLGFVVLSPKDWKDLEKHLGKERLEYYFLPVEVGMEMFRLDFDEAQENLTLRAKNRHIHPKVIMDYVGLGTRENALKEQKQTGEIDLKTYAKEGKAIRQQREDMIRDHNIQV